MVEFEGFERTGSTAGFGKNEESLQDHQRMFLWRDHALPSFWAVVIGSLLSGLSNGLEAGSEVVYAIVSGLFILLILWNLTRLFDQVVKSAEPFSKFQADRLSSISVIALAYAVLDLLVSFGFMLQPAPELGFAVVANDGIAEPTLNLNVGMLAFSAIMYSLSAIFRYAALLQQLSDETV